MSNIVFNFLFVKISLSLWYKYLKLLIKKKSYGKIS